MGTTNLDSLELSGDLTVTGAQIITGGEVLAGSQVVGLGMSVGSNAAITGALTVGGTASLTGAVTMVAGASIGSNATITGTLGVTGITTLSQDLEITDTSTGFLRVQTTSTAAAGVIMAMATPADNTGDLYVRYTQGGSSTWAVGCDTSDTAAFVINQGSSPSAGGSTSFVKVSLAGAVTIGGATGTQTHTINTGSGTTVGSDGTAAAIPTPVLYIPILLGTVSYKMALLNP